MVNGKGKCAICHCNTFGRRGGINGRFLSKINLINPPASLDNGWRRLTLHYMNNGDAEPLHPAHTIFIFARLQRPLATSDETVVRRAVQQALPSLRRVYRTYTYDASCLAVQDGQIIYANRDNNVKIVLDEHAPDDFDAFIAYCLQHVPRFNQPLFTRLSPHGYMHLCFNHALADGMEIKGFMTDLVKRLAVVERPLADIKPLTIHPEGSYRYSHWHLDVGRAGVDAVYHRAVYALGKRWGVRYINQLVAGDTPEHKVSLAAARFTDDWPAFLRHNRAQTKRAKQWRNRFGFWSLLLKQGNPLPLYLYDALCHFDWMKRPFRAWTMGDLQISSIMMSNRNYLMFPVHHPAQQRAVVLGGVWTAAGRTWVQVNVTELKEGNR